MMTSIEANGAFKPTGAVILTEKTVNIEVEFESRILLLGTDPPDETTRPIIGRV